MAEKTSSDGEELPVPEAALTADAGKAEPPEQPLDAIVYDVHPAVSAARESPTWHYPYSNEHSFAAAKLPPPNSAPQATPTQAAGYFATWAARRIGSFSHEYVDALSRPAEFMVPKTFGMSAILGIMTALAFVFGALRWLDAYPVFYFFFAVEALAICLAQMLYGKSPRLASIVMGAVILPAFTVVAVMFAPVRPRDMPGIGCLMIAFVPCGAVLGYLTGTCAAGTFLVMEYLEPYLQGRGISIIRRRDRTGA
jgi:hypothetical protein